MQVEDLIDNLKGLPPERVVEVEDFIDFLAQRERDDRRLIQAATKLSEESSKQVWDNEEDAAYDQL